MDIIWISWISACHVHFRLSGVSRVETKDLGEWFAVFGFNQFQTQSLQRISWWISGEVHVWTCLNRKICNCWSRQNAGSKWLLTQSIWAPIPDHYKPQQMGPQSEGFLGVCQQVVPWTIASQWTFAMVLQRRQARQWEIDVLLMVPSIAARFAQKVKITWNSERVSWCIPLFQFAMWPARCLLQRECGWQVILFVSLPDSGCALGL